MRVTHAPTGLTTTACPSCGVSITTMARTMSRLAPSPLDELKTTLATDLAETIGEARQEFLATLRPQITD